MYAKMLTIGDDELIADLIDNIEAANDSPPYDADDFPGGADNADVPLPVRWASVNATQGSTTVAGFIAPCGLIKVSANELSLTNTTEVLSDLSDAASAAACPGPLSVYQSSATPTFPVIITVAAGPYRGVLAAPMGQ